MTDNLDQEGRFEPLHEAHSIENIAVVMQIGQPLEPEEFAKICKLAEKFQSPEHFARWLPQTSIVINVGAATPAQSAGVVFQTLAANGSMEKELRIESTKIVFSTTKYNRWTDFWKEARQYFSELAELYIAKSSINAIGLSYKDKFKWTGNTELCQWTELLRGDSKYIPPHVYQLHDLWHSHTGAFIRVDKMTKRLVNVNADCNDQPAANSLQLQRHITIATGLTDLFNQPGYEPLVVDNVMNFLDTKAKELHDYSKSIFGNVINDKTKERVALKDALCH